MPIITTEGLTEYDLYLIPLNMLLDKEKVIQIINIVKKNTFFYVYIYNIKIYM